MGTNPVRGKSVQQGTSLHRYSEFPSIPRRATDSLVNQPVRFPPPNPKIPGFSRQLLTTIEPVHPPYDETVTYSLPLLMKQQETPEIKVTLT
jgi:hypothetical protein